MDQKHLDVPAARSLLGGRLLPSFCCPWRLAAALVLLHLAAGCCSGGWLLPLVRLLPGG